MLHKAKLLTRDFAAVRTWMKKKHTLPEIQNILAKGLMHLMEYGTPIAIWELADTQYKEDLENAIQAQNFIGWDNLLKGQIARDWGDIQMKYYEEYYEEVPTYLSAAVWASDLIRQS